MKRIKVSEASGSVLDWLVAKAEGHKFAPVSGAGSIWFELGIWAPGHSGAESPYVMRHEYNHWVAQCEGGVLRHGTRIWEPSIDWAQGGPIIDREGISLRPIRRPGHELDGQCLAAIDHGNTGTMVQWVKNTSWRRHFWRGPTTLIASLRCYVASKLGEEVEVPEELLS